MAITTLSELPINRAKLEQLRQRAEDAQTSYWSALRDLDKTKRGRPMTTRKDPHKPVRGLVLGGHNDIHAGTRCCKLGVWPFAGLANLATDHPGSNSSHVQPLPVSAVEG